MATIESLLEYFKKIQFGCEASERFDFGVRLLENETAEFLDFHYSLLARIDTDQELYSLICRKFRDRGIQGEEYLLSRIKTEENDHLKAITLQILGTFQYSGGSHLLETAHLARAYLNSPSEILRCRALWVLGWVGTEDDIDRISILLFSDASHENRCWAATAMMQIVLHNKLSTNKALPFLATALNTEKNSKVVGGILVAIQEITGKSLGLSARSPEAASEEKIEKALKKAKKLFL